MHNTVDTALSGPAFLHGHERTPIVPAKPFLIGSGLSMMSWSSSKCRYAYLCIPSRFQLAIPLQGYLSIQVISYTRSVREDAQKSSRPSQRQPGWSWTDFFATPKPPSPDAVWG